jgi:HPt (histidine-containing phosphotransfer) domain-containing protein
MDDFAAKPLCPDKIEAMIHNLSERAGAAIAAYRGGEPERMDLDLSIFAYMSDRNPERMRQLVEQFIATLDQDVARLVGAVDAGDIETTRQQAHNLLSQTALVSATQVATVATAIQEAARNGDINTPRSRLDSFAAGINCLKESLRSAL